MPTAQQQASLYYARKRRKAREASDRSEFKVKGVQVGIKLKATLTVQ